VTFEVAGAFDGGEAKVAGTVIEVPVAADTTQYLLAKVENVAGTPPPLMNTVVPAYTFEKGVPLPAVIVAVVEVALKVHVPETLIVAFWSRRLTAALVASVLRVRRM
jgi:hypothetical protein